MSKYGSSLLRTEDAPAASRVTFNLRRNLVLAGVWIRFYATYTVTGGTGAGTILANALHRYLRNIQVLGDGQTLQSVSAETLQAIAEYLMPRAPVQTQPIALAAATNAAVELVLFLPFHQLHSLTPDEYAFPAPFIDNPQLVIDTGNPSDMATGQDGVLGFTNPKIEVTEQPLLDSPQIANYGLVGIQTVTKKVDVARDDFVIEFPGVKAGQAVRAIILEGEEYGAGGVKYRRNDTVIDSFRLNINGQNVLDRTKFALQQNRNAVRYNLAAKRTGSVILDAAENEHTSSNELWGVVAGGTPFVEATVAPTVNGDNRVRATVLVAIPPR